jgi:hypothetical protein
MEVGEDSGQRKRDLRGVSYLVMRRCLFGGRHSRGKLELKFFQAFVAMISASNAQSLEAILITHY